MYRQPENSNRVKSMKSKFEGLNVSSVSHHDKIKKSPVRDSVSTKTVNNNVKIIKEKLRRLENNNNLKIDSNKMTNNERSSKDKFVVSNKLDKDFSDVNKKELCTVPPLNLTRQLNDPSKKGCIKRTPAFRKDKLNNRMKSDEMDFANIVKLFEGNTDNTKTCDTVDSSKNKTEDRTDFKVNLMSKQTISVSERPKLTASLSSAEITKSDIQKLTTSVSLILDKKILNETATLKISDRNDQKVPLVKELIQTLSNNEQKLLINESTKENVIKTLPSYAQIDKSKKKEITTGNIDITLTDTLKAALKQPLPSGPPPKKPPRTFAHTSQKDEELKQITSDFCEKLNENLEQHLNKTQEKTIKIKSDPKLMLQKLENALLNNKIRSPKLPKKLTTFDSSKSAQNENSSPKNLFPNCLPSLSCVSRTSANNSYAKINPKAINSSTFFTEVKTRKQEPIYAEPFEFQEEHSQKVVNFKPNDSDGRADTLSNSLHYMSNPVVEWCLDHKLQSEEQQNIAKNATQCTKKDLNSSEVESGPLTRQKLNLIMNRTYAAPSPSDSDFESLPSTPSSDDTPLSKRSTIKDLILNFEQKQQNLEPSSLNYTPKQQLTVSSSWPADKGKLKNENDLTSEEKKKFKTQLNRTLTEIRKNYVKRVRSTLKRKPEKKQDKNLFECCLLVGLNVANLQPYIKNKYPENYEVPPWVEHLCFPDASSWSPSNGHSQDCQCYSLVITDEKGERKYGYCRRVVPEEASVCLPLTYCIISSCRANGFYHKVLKELESRHGLPYGLQDAFVKELYSAKFPLPGESVKISCLLRSLVVNSCEEMMKNNQISTPENIECVKRIVCMQNGIYGCLNKQQSDEIPSEWSIVQESDFRVPKNTYGGKNDSEMSNCSTIDKYTKEFWRCNSVNNSTESLETIDIRPRVNQSFVPHNQNSRSSEPQINKRIGQIFDELQDLAIGEENNSDFPNKFDHKKENDNSLLNLSNNQLLHDCLLGDVILRRPLDSRLEDADLTTLFNTLNLETLLQTFGSLLHERKVIFVSSCLSKLSSCVEALQSILYPFDWQHTFIPVLSNNMLDILSAPLPLICGVLSDHITETLIIEEGIAVNLDTSTVVCYMGDENDIIPKRLVKGLTQSLQLISESREIDDQNKNVYVSDAFIRMFAEACGSYKQYVVLNDTGQKIFERENFITNHPSKAKCIKWFLEWFSETAMFNHFIQSHLDGELADSVFEERCIELNSAQKNLNVAQKVKHFGHRLFH